MSEFIDLSVYAGILAFVVCTSFLGTKSCVCVCVFDRYIWAGTSDHGAIRVHLGGLAGCAGRDQHWSRN